MLSETSSMALKHWHLWVWRLASLLMRRTLLITLEQDTKDFHTAAIDLDHMNLPVGTGRACALYATEALTLTVRAKRMS